MTTLLQLANPDETWSLEEEGDLYIHHVWNDGPRVVIPITRDVLQTMAARLSEAVPISDRRQNVIPFPVRRSV